MEIISKENPDLIISDITMPKINGFDLYEKVRNRYEFNDIPFVFLTARTDRDSLRYGMNIGADDFITKPYSSDEILNSVEMRLKKKNQAETKMNNLKSSIAKYIPHELRTPLVPIIGYSEFILENKSSINMDEVEEMVSEIKGGVTRLHTSIEKFILYSQLETSATNFDRYSITKNAIEETILLQLLDPKRRSDLVIDVEESVIRISQEYINIILMELIENACKFSKLNSTIEVSGRIVDSNYQLVIKDYGRGMKMEEINNIGAFEQFEKEKFQQQGNGLGLMLVKRIMKKVNGKFEIESIKGKYTIVNLTFYLF